MCFEAQSVHGVDMSDCGLKPHKFQESLFMEIVREHTSKSDCWASIYIIYADIPKPPLVVSLGSGQHVRRRLQFENPSDSPDPTAHTPEPPRYVEATGG